MKEMLIAVRVTFWVSQVIVFLIVMAPATRFYVYGWGIRKEEFTNRIANAEIDLYLARFWGSTIAERGWKACPSGAQFYKVYDVISGRRIYVVPMIVLGASLVLFGGMAVQCAVRMGYEFYVQTYITTKALEPTVFTEVLSHLSLASLDAVFLPFPPLMLNTPSLSAVAGAYLAVVQIVIYGYKTRTLLSSDLLWASFRLMIAIPLGYSVSLLVAPGLGSLITFGLGAIPMGAIIKLLRRLTARSLNDAERDNTDDLLKMVGVTPDVSARLNDEGIYSPQQLADTDPVSLAIRAGLSFDFVLNLVAQSQVWSFLGDTAAKMAPLGCGDARAIHKLLPNVTGDAGTNAPILAALSGATNIEARALMQILQMIADDPFTLFLVSLGDSSKSMTTSLAENRNRNKRGLDQAAEGSVSLKPSMSGD